MIEVMGEFLADGDVCADAPIKEIVGMSDQQSLQSGRQKVDFVEDMGAELQVNADPPRQGFARPKKRPEHGNQYYFKSHQAPCRLFHLKE